MPLAERNGNPNIQIQFECTIPDKIDPITHFKLIWDIGNGTINFAPYLTIPDGKCYSSSALYRATRFLISYPLTLALAFRKWLGGEEKINEYCHDLAMKGGKLLSERWGTALMDTVGNQTCHMVRVRILSPLS